ncbi:MAG: phage portal protein [Pseudonocardiaceae bacterium]
MATPEQAASILNKLVEELRRRQQDDGATEYGVETLEKAYRGDFNLKYASKDFDEFHADRYKNYADNWTGIVADAPHERLEPIGIRLKGEKEGDGELWDTWRDNDADALCDLAMLDAIIAKRAFALVWGTTDDEARITWEHPSQAIVDYDPETRERRSGAKVWADDEHEYATLYLPHEVWKFQRSRIQTTLILSEQAKASLTGAWEPRDEGMMKNPLGKVPLVEMANRPRLLGEPHSDIAGVLASQHVINLLWAETFAVADEATIGQRLIIGAIKPVVPVLDENGNIVAEKELDLRKWRRDRTGWIEDPLAKAHEWKPAALDPFTAVIEIMIGHIAAQTRTPAHYLLIGGTMANVSADAMKALETGLVKRTEEKTQHFGRAIRDVFELVALVEDSPAKAKAVRGGRVLWKDVENRSDAQVADAAVKDSQIGLPLQYILEKRYNLPPAEINRVMAMVRENQADPVAQALINELGSGSTDASPAPVSA